MMRWILPFVILFVCLVAVPVQAECFDASTFVGVGVGINPGALGVPIGLRLRGSCHTPAMFEEYLYLPYGLGAKISFDILRYKRWSAHGIDFGIFVPFHAALRLSRPDVDRVFDITLGTGIEYTMSRNSAIGLDWTMFFPDPFSVPFYYGGFSKAIYREAALGGHLWLSYVRHF